MARDDLIREAKAYRSQLLAELRATEDYLRKMGVDVDAATSRPRGGILVPTGGKRPVSASENGTYELLRKIGAELEPGGSLDARTAIELLESRGWETDATNKMNTVNTAMNRLAGWDEWEKVGRGRYRPRRNHDAAADVEPRIPVKESDDVGETTLTSIFGRAGDAAHA